MEMSHAAANPCQCPECPVIVHHWFCSHCGGGPYDIRTHPWRYRQQLPPDRDIKTHLSPKVLYFCSAACELHVQRDNEQREAVAAGKWSTAGAHRGPSSSEGN